MFREKLNFINSTFKLSESLRPDICWLRDPRDSLRRSENIPELDERVSDELPYCLPYGWKIQKENLARHAVKLTPDLTLVGSVLEPDIDGVFVICELTDVRGLVADFLRVVPGEATPDLSRGCAMGGVDVIAKSSEGILSKHSTFETG